MNKATIIGIAVASAASWGTIDIILMLSGYLIDITVTPYMVTEYWLVYIMTTIIMYTFLDKCKRYLEKKADEKQQ